MTNDDMDNLKSLALVAFLNDYACSSFLNLESDHIEDIGKQAGLDRVETTRCLAALFEIHVRRRDEITTWLRRTAN